jgi:hypothetical protein
VKDRLVEALRKGAYKDDACDYAGIHKSTFYRWLELGDAQGTGQYREFSDVIHRADAEGIMVNLSTIYTAAKEGDWRAAAWALEHKQPVKYGGKTTHDVNLNVPEHQSVIEARVEEFFEELKQRGIKLVRPGHVKEDLDGIDDDLLDADE